MNNFCTLFDSNYLPKGLCLYESLLEQCAEDFCLYILATNDIAYEWLKKQNLEKVEVCSLEDIKKVYPVLIELQQKRSIGEFNWTLSSFSIQFFLRKYNLDSITYLDADLYFYADPKILINEVKEESVIITPHNYTPEYDQSAVSGRYCVQFMYFKNNTDGNKVLEWWRNACEECCTSIPKDGKFGDQKYLDDWLSRFPGIVHEAEHMGCGIAPWNVQQFFITEESRQIYVTNKITKVKDKLLFYHFHGTRAYYDKKGYKYWDLNSGYDLNNNCIHYLYKDYINLLDDYNKNAPELTKILLPRMTNKIVLFMISIKRCCGCILRSLNLLKYYNELKLKNIYKANELC